MGHKLYSGLPRTPRFSRIVALLGNSAGAGGAVGLAPGTLEEIADATFAASDTGLERAKSDEGLAYSLYLMATLTRAATQTDFAAALSNAGLPAPFAPTGSPDHPIPPSAESSKYTVFDLVSGFSAAVDRHLRETRSRTDIGELAQLAASESLSVLCSGEAVTLFGTSKETVQESLRKLSTEKGFAGSHTNSFRGYPDATWNTTSAASYRTTSDQTDASQASMSTIYSCGSWMITAVSPLASSNNLRGNGIASTSFGKTSLCAKQRDLPPMQWRRCKAH